MIIPIETDLRGFLRSYLTILNPILKLKDMEITVLSSFLMVWHPNREVEGIEEILFSTKVRKAVRESVGISEASFNNHITSLRKKKIIQGKVINPSILKNLDSDSTEITYRLSWKK